MRVMVIVKATKESEAENSPLEMEGAAEMFEAMGKYNEELVKAGIMLAGDGLKPSKFGKRIHFNGTKRSVTDGPFAETKELVAGFWIWQVRSMEEAIEWAKRCPADVHRAEIQRHRRSAQRRLDDVVDRRYYTPSNHGFEKEIADRMSRLQDDKDDE